jgi:hypothetical protein
MVMRTTIDFDEDLVLVAKQLAAQRQTTMGRIVSEYFRKGLEPGKVAKMRNGFPLFEPKLDAPKPSLELVNRLRDSE